MALRLFPGDTDEQAAMVACAARLCGTPLTISFDPSDDRSKTLASLGCTLRKEPLDNFLASISEYKRIHTFRSDQPAEMYTNSATSYK